jgi:hypothetical protein
MNVEKYLNKNGFSTTVEWGPEKKFHFIIGSKGISDENLLKEEDNMIHEVFVSENEEKTFLDTIHQMEKEDKIMEEIAAKENSNGDKGDSGIHSENACAMPEGRSASGGSEQPDKGEPCDTIGREVDSEGESKIVLPEKSESGHSGVLQPVVEKSTEETVRDKDIQKVEKTPRPRRRSTTRKNSGSRSKPVVQKDAPQNDGVGDKDATC